MQLWLVNNLSLPALTLFFTLACASISLLFYLFSHRYYSGCLSKFFADNNYFHSILITFSTILFAFTIISLWQTFLSSQSAVSEAASALSKIVLNSNAFPEKEKHLINDAVRQYTQTLIHEEWPLMQEGKTSPVAETALHNMYAALQAYHPQNAFEQIFYEDSLTNIGVVYQNRRVRLDHLKSLIPLPLQYIIVLSSFLLIVIGALSNTKEKRSHIVLMMVTSIILGANLAFITAFDYPFSGTISVSSQAFQSGVLDVLLRIKG